MPYTFGSESSDAESLLCSAPPARRALARPRPHTPDRASLSSSVRRPAPSHHSTPPGLMRTNPYADALPGQAFVSNSWMQVRPSGSSAQDGKVASHRSGDTTRSFGSRPSSTFSSLAEVMVKVNPRRRPRATSSVRSYGDEPTSAGSPELGSGVKNARKREKRQKSGLGRASWADRASQAETASSADDDASVSTVRESTAVRTRLKHRFVCVLTLADSQLSEPTYQCAFEGCSREDGSDNLQELG